jgi:LPS-assembly protein
MKNARVWVVVSLLVMLLPSSLHAQMGRKSKATGPVEITADELNYNKEQNIYTARGNVDVKEGTRRLNADFVLYNDTTKDAFAEGHVIFQDQGDVIHAEKMSLNLITKRGHIEKGRIFVKTGNFFLNGDDIEKTGESSYVVHRGQFTTCGWEKPAWTFVAQEVDLTMGEYATAYSTTFTVRDHSVLYLPWSMFPVKTERQSGFLMPLYQSSSRDGMIFRNGYYWAISKDKDATFFFDWIDQRGYKPGVEYRYALTPTTRGMWYFSDIEDKKYHGDRFQIKGEHEQVFGDMSFKTNINYVSDSQYLQDLGRTTLERAENSQRSVAFVEKPFPYSLLTVETAYFKDLTQKNNSATEQYLPYVSYFTEYLPVLKDKFYTDVSTDLANFTRGTGDKVTRFTATPSLRIPYSWNGLNFLASASASERAYHVDDPVAGEDNDAHHEQIRMVGDMNAVFVKDTHTDFFKLGDIQSMIVPRVEYNYVQNRSSFAGVPSTEPTDRISNTDTVTYSFNHYLNAVSNGQVKEISLLEVSQTYGLANRLPADQNVADPFPYTGSGSRLSDIHERFTLFPNSSFYYINDTQLDVEGYGRGLQSMTNSIHYARLPQFQVDLTHSYEPGLVDQVWLNTIFRWRMFDVVYQERYDFLLHSWQNTLASITYRAGCWSVSFSDIETKVPRDRSYHLSFNLSGLSQRLTGSPAAGVSTGAAASAAGSPLGGAVGAVPPAPLGTAVGGTPGSP